MSYLSPIATAIASGTRSYVEAGVTVVQARLVAQIMSRHDELVDYDVIVCGAHPNPALARAQVLGEARERLLSASADVLSRIQSIPHGQQLAPDQENPVPAVDGWVRAIGMRTGVETSYPAERVIPRWDLLGRHISALHDATGLASHPNIADCKISALLEVIERHGAISLWDGALGCRMIDRAVVFEVLNAEGISAEPAACVRVQIACAHVVVVALQSPSGILTCGSAARCSLHEAIVKATCEAIMLQETGRQFSTRIRYSCSTEVTTSLDHVVYASTRGSEVIDRIESQAEATPLHRVSDLKRSSFVARVAAEMGSEPVWVDLTPDNWNVERVYVGRAIVPTARTKAWHHSDPALMPHPFG